jgi:hypothetical protein
VRNYLLAVNASAVYVTMLHGTPHRIGATASVDQALKGLRRHTSEKVDYAWMMWTRRECAEQIISSKNILTRFRYDGVRVARSLPDVIKGIEEIAAHHNITLTKHDDVVRRALRLSALVDRAMAQLQAQGEMRAFNYGYRQRRLWLRAKGESVADYRIIKGKLVQLVIQELVRRQPGEALNLEAVLLRFSQEFPWFAHARKQPVLTKPWQKSISCAKSSREEVCA